MKNLPLRRLACLTLLAGSWFLAATVIADEVEDPGISEIVRRHFPENAEGGLALLVVRDGKILHAKGYGKRYGKTPITPDTRMPLASVTKQFAAMCAAILIEEKKLEMSDPVSKYLPDLKFSGAGRELLIRDLVWHTSGLPNFIKADERASIEQYKKEHGLEHLTNKTHAEWLATLPLLRAPGVEHEYTNSGYVLLARIIEVVAGKPFHEFQQERIFDVLGMKDTTDSSRFNGSGNMTITLRDYAKWDRALWDQTLLNEETSKLLFQSGTLNKGEPVGYGFGWRVEYEDGKLKEVRHSGVGSPKSSARNIIVRDMENRITVALFVRENLTFGKVHRREFADEIRKFVLKETDSKE